MTDVYRKIITAVNIETGDDGTKAHKVLETFHELLRMDNKQYEKQQRFYGWAVDQEHQWPGFTWAIGDGSRLKDQATSGKPQAASVKPQAWQGTCIVL